MGISTVGKEWEGNRRLTKFPVSEVQSLLNFFAEFVLLKYNSDNPAVDSERLSSRTSFQLEDEVLDTSEP